MEKGLQYKIIQNVKEKKIIAIVRGFEVEECVALSAALYAGGINMVEITFDQQKPNAYYKTTEAIRQVTGRFQGSMYVGAGTVLTTEQVDLAKDAGALYIISPDMNPEVICYTKKLGLISIPGAMSPTEIVNAHRAGADFVKIFPIVSLGSEYIKALKGPLSHIELLAVGGVSEKNIGEFLNAGVSGVGVGGMLTKKALVKAKEFEGITQLAREYVNHAKSAN